LSNGENNWFGGVGHVKSIVDIAVSADGEHLWSVGLDDKIRMNEVKSLTFSNEALSLGGMPVQIAASRKESNLAAVVLAQEKLVIVRAGKIASTLDIGFRPNCVAFSPDEKELAVGGNDMKIHLYSLTKDEPKAGKVLSGHVNRVLCLRYSPDGSLLVSSDSNRIIYIWKDGVIQNSTGWPFHNSAVSGISFSPSGKLLASCSIDQDILVWTDMKTFDSNCGKILLSHNIGVDHVEFVDESTLVSTGADRCVKIWKLK